MTVAATRAQDERPRLRPFLVVDQDDEYRVFAPSRRAVDAVIRDRRRTTGRRGAVRVAELAMSLVSPPDSIGEP